jgi:spore coat polysaccharide biosynthesis protein SpsF
MVAGQSNNHNIGFIIQARLGSVRLSGKVLLPLPFSHGKPMLQWIVDQLQTSIHIHKTVLATSEQPTDDQLANYCKNNNIYCFRGDINDVLSRYIAVTKENGFDTVVRLTGDNPLLDVDVLDQTVQFHLDKSNDYTSSEGMPLGMNIEVVSGKTLLDLENKPLTEPDREHVTRYIRRTDEYKKGVFSVQHYKELGKLRLTVDYPSDYAVLSILLSLYKESDRTGIGLIGYVLEHYPWVFDINRDNIQRKQFESESEEIKAAVKFLKKAEMKRAAERLEEHET